jgi:hypothetical protein
MQLMNPSHFVVFRERDLATQIVVQLSFNLQSETMRLQVVDCLLNCIIVTNKEQVVNPNGNETNTLVVMPHHHARVCISTDETNNL